jgi:hypothetical protein
MATKPRRERSSVSILVSDTGVAMLYDRATGETRLLTTGEVSERFLEAFRDMPW